MARDGARLSDRALQRLDVAAEQLEEQPGENLGYVFGGMGGDNAAFAIDG